MQGSGFGDIFHISTFGESHGRGVGVVIDGVPAGLSLSADDILPMLIRRRPGQSVYASARQEEDKVEIYSGLFEGKTTGTPIMMLIHNTDQRSKDYSDIAELFRPGHGDYTYQEKYGIRDYRGGGRSSARETIGRVCAGAVAVKALKQIVIEFITYTETIGPVEFSSFDRDFIHKNPLGMPDRDALQKAMDYLDEIRAAGDSAGGSAVCIVTGAPAGLGDPVFNKLDASLSAAVMSIGAVKSVEIGEGVGCSVLKGSQNNDAFLVQDGKVTKDTNYAGGILSGISDGSDIVIRAHFKPTPSISIPQQTVDINGNEKEITIHGRHDPVVVPRALVVMESMAAIVIFDAVLKNMTSKMEDVIRFYGEKS